MKKLATSLVFCTALLAISSASAQFSGPSVTGRQATVAQALESRAGTYLTLEGNIVNHLRGDYFTFSDASASMRVEISPSVWRGVQVGPNDRVRIMGEVDRSFAGRYIWVKTLEKL